MADQAERLRTLSKEVLASKSKDINAENTSLSHVIAITSGKGGVGKSTFTVNLALALANYGKKVLIIDADLGMANIDVMMGCIAKYSMIDIIEGTMSFDDAVVTGPRNIRLLPGGSGIKTLPGLNNLELQRILSQSMQYEKNMDFILFDTGAGMSSTVMNFLLAADDVFLVTTPEPTSLTDAYSIVKAYCNNCVTNTAPLHLVVNRVENTDESHSVAQKLCKVTNKFLHVDIEQLGYIFEDSSVSLSIRSQNPLMLQFPNSPAAVCIEKIAHKLVFGYEKAEKSGFSGFFKKFLNIYK